MKYDYITTKQLKFIIGVIIFGNTAMIGFNSEVAQDTWIAFLMAVLASLAAVLVYVRIISLYPGKNLFDIMQDALGAAAGKILTLLMVVYALFLASNTICIFNFFMRMTALIGTPRLVISVIIVFVAAYLALSRISTFGKGSVTMFYFLLTIAVLTIILSFAKLADFNNLYPLFEHSFGKLVKSAWNIFAMPFGETILILGFADAIKREKNDSIYKTFIYGILIGASVLLAIYIRNLLLLGHDLLEISYFPSFSAAKLIGIQGVFERIEGLITYNFIIAGIAKLVVCLIAASKGIAKLFGLKNYRAVVLPTSLLILSLCKAGSNSILELVDFMNIYHYYALPFHIIIPLIVWIAAEIKTRINRQKEKNTQGAP